MLINLLRLIFIVCALAFVFMLVRAWWHKRQQGSLEPTPFWPVAASDLSPIFSIPWGLAALP